MRPSLRFLAVIALASALAATAAHAQSLYFLESDDRPVAPGNITPTASFRTPPTTFGRRGFFHWDLREFANCAVPWCNTVAATGDASTTPNNARTAIENAFNTWDAVSPAIINFNRTPNSVAINTAGMDNNNTMLWDGGIAANLTALGAPGSGTLAVTFIFYDGRCRIRESDILFNDVDYQWKNGNNSLSLYVPSANTPTFALADGQTLTLKINGGAVQTITFRAADFADIANATRAEVAAEINGQLVGGSAASLTSNVVGIRSSRTTYDGNTSIEVTGGTANGVLGFPTTVWISKGVDVESIALHEIGHFLGIHHTSQANPEPNLVLFNAAMFWLAPPDGTTKRALAPNDVQALNFLYTPDLGDAPDGALNAVSGSYQSHVHTTLPQGGAAGTLNGVTRFQPGDGPVHLFGFKGPNIPAAPPVPAQDYSKDRFEWLGADMDDNAAECEARLTDQDQFDDGVTLAKFTKGKPTRITVMVTRSTVPGRYAAVDSARINFNGYIDFNNDSKFTSPADLQLWWAGIPAATVAAGTLTSKNFVPALSDLSTNPMKLVFDVPVPANAPDNTWGRFRLDFGEDEGRASNVPAGGWEGNLAPATGEAQFGEVEDYPIEATTQRLVTSCPQNQLVAGDSPSNVHYQFGNAGAILDQFCWSVTDRLGWIQGATPGVSGNSLVPPDQDVAVDVSVQPPVDCFEGEVDTLVFLAWPCNDPPAADTCITLIQCAGATPTLIARFEGRTGTDFVELDYALAPGVDATGVNVLRSDASGAGAQPVTKSPLPVDGRSQYQYVDHDVVPGTTYHYTLSLIGKDGTTHASAPIELRTQPAVFALRHPTPNPSATGFTVDLSMAKTDVASLRLIDVSGRAVRTLLHETLAAGEHRVAWDGLKGDGSRASNGVYYLVFESGGKRITRTVIVAR